jgi:hypothetical protein
MPSQRQQALADFRRIIKWIVLVAVVMVAVALFYLHLTGDLDANMAIATTLGVFFSVVLGCGLFAAAFFSAKSGVDEEVADATRKKHEGTER